MAYSFDPSLKKWRSLVKEMAEKVNAMNDGGKDFFGGSDKSPEQVKAFFDGIEPNLELLKEDTFWLSETPEVPGSVSWRSACRRIVTWGIFRIKDGDGVWREMENGDPGEAFDSENPDWTDADTTMGVIISHHRRPIHGEIRSPAGSDMPGECSVNHEH